MIVREKEGDDPSKAFDACMYIRIALIIWELEYVGNFPSQYKRTVSNDSFERFDRPSESNIALTVPRRVRIWTSCK